MAPPACMVANSMAAFLQAKDARSGQSRLDGRKEMQDARDSVVFSRTCQGPALARGPLCISGPRNFHWRSVTTSGDPSSTFKAWVSRRRSVGQGRRSGHHMRRAIGRPGTSVQSARVDRTGETSQLATDRAVLRPGRRVRCGSPCSEQGAARQSARRGLKAGVPSVPARLFSKGA